MKTKHENRTRAHVVWDNMKRRCLKANHPKYPSYGGRGITVCERWMSFENFLEDMGQPPTGMTLERKNNNGNYDKDNCCWATRKIQQNNRRTNSYISFHGETRTVSQWAERIGIKNNTLLYRLRRGWNVSRALTAETYSNEK